MSLFTVHESTIDAEKLAKAFANNYYTTINKGWVYVMNLYDTSAKCLINGRLMSPCEMVTSLAVNHISKAQIYNHKLHFMKNYDCLTVSVTSIMVLLNQNDFIQKKVFVSDHFRISLSKRKIMEHTCNMREDFDIKLPDSCYSKLNDTFEYY
jgi:hypothetical protein